MSNAIAVSVLPGELRVLVAAANGAAKPLHQLKAQLPEGAVLAGLEPPNLPDIEAVGEVFAALADTAEARRDRGAEVSVLLPDSAVRMALVPLEGAAPNRVEGEAMARWALKDLLVADTENARIDWAVVADEILPECTWLLAIGADREVVREYEAVVERAGLSPGRVVPLTMALAVGAAAANDDGDANDDDAGGARLVLSGVGDQVACLVEAGGVPRFHRAWRGANPQLELELPTIQRYVETRLDLQVSDAVVAGPEAWRQGAALDCEALGWKVHPHSSWAAHLGAVQP